MCGASGSFLRITRTILASSSIRSARFWSRPAVSIIRRSAPLSCARVIASKTRLAGSEPCAAVSTGTPARSPQTWSCSTAAARKVSPAAITTDLPAARNWLASLPMVVVLPDPLTPTTSTTCGRRAVSGMGRATGSRMRATSAASASRISRALTRRPIRPCAMLAVTRSAVSTPMSAPISTSSRFSSIASSKMLLGSDGGAPISRPRRPGLRRAPCVPASVRLGLVQAPRGPGARHPNRRGRGGPWHGRGRRDWGQGPGLARDGGVGSGAGTGSGDGRGPPPGHRRRPRPARPAPRRAGWRSGTSSRAAFRRTTCSAPSPPGCASPRRSHPRGEGPRPRKGPHPRAGKGRAPEPRPAGSRRENICPRYGI